jgi:hypothetical protein
MVMTRIGTQNLCAPLHEFASEVVPIDTDDAESVSSESTGYRECKMLGIKSTDPDPLGESKLAPWTKHDPVTGEPSGRLSGLGRKTCQKYYKGKTEAQVYKLIQEDPRQRVIFEALAKRFVDAKLSAFTFCFVSVPIRAITQHMCMAFIDGIVAVASVTI